MLQRRVGDVPMRWAEQGEGPAVVFLHGIPTSPLLWRHVLPRIPHGRCLAWEMVGYGSSLREGVGRHISVSRQADHLLAWLEALGIESAVLVGHDLGGGVAQIAAVRRPELCSGLVLTNSIAYDSWPIPEMLALRWLGPAVERLPDLLFGPILRAFVQRGHDDAKRGAESADLHWRAYAGHGGAEAFVRQIRALHTGDTLAVAEALPGLSVPARIVWGVADPFQKLEYGERLSRDLRAPLARIEQGSHFTPEDHPDAIAEAVVELLKEPAAAPAREARERDAQDGRETSDGPRPSAGREAPEPRPSQVAKRAPDWERREQAKVPPRGTARGEADPVLAARPGEHPAPRDPARKRRAPKHPAENPLRPAPRKGGGSSPD